MMNIDEAIAQAERIAEGQEKSAELSPSNHAKERISKSASDHRQLAAWLTELKELRLTVGMIKVEDLKSALTLLREYKAENNEMREQIEEYKRLLKSAANVLNTFIPCDDDYCSECIKQRQNCDYDDSFKWRYAYEAKKLIGGKDNDS